VRAIVAAIIETGVIDMPTEFRFDDLDLREEPPTGKSEAADYSMGSSCAATTSKPCTTNTVGCCSVMCDLLSG
jgi:hypothetical protein